jgi:hypothetical protein
LAFIPSKYRLGPEPEPFCLELQLPGGSPWSLEDVTRQLQEAGEQAKAGAEAAHKAELIEAAHALSDVVIERYKTGRPLRKTEAETFLQKEQELNRADARTIIKERTGILWKIVSGERGRGKGPAQILIPPDGSSYTPSDGGRINDVREAAADNPDNHAYSADRSGTEQQNKSPSEPWETSAPESPLFRCDSGVLEDSPAADYEEGEL